MCVGREGPPEGRRGRLDERSFSVFTGRVSGRRMIKGLLVRHLGLRQPSIARRATDGPRIVYKILDAFCWTAELTRMTEGVV